MSFMSYAQSDSQRFPISPDLIRQNSLLALGNNWFSLLHIGFFNSVVFISIATYSIHGSSKLQVLRIACTANNWFCSFVGSSGKTMFVEQLQRNQVPPLCATSLKCLVPS